MNPPATEWRPGASLDRLRLRASLLERVRAFMRDRAILEVNTPCLSRQTTADPSIAVIEARALGERCFLQTSPEHAMKRLVAAGSGAIYQIAPAFRDGEIGRWHNPEFSLLEWYRPGFDHHTLMDEVEALIGEVLGGLASRRVTYREAFIEYVGIDPFDCELGELARAAAETGWRDTDDGTPPAVRRDQYLDVLVSTRVAPSLGRGLVFVHGYPPSQAALARIAPPPTACAERFEAYVDSIELANGYHELTDADEHVRRVSAELERRRALGLASMPRDARFLAAIRHGLPACAGVALGFDRLVALAADARSLDEVLAFSFDRV